MKPAGRERFEKLKKHIQSLDTSSRLYEWVQPENYETPWERAGGSTTPSISSGRNGLYEGGARTPSSGSTSTAPIPIPSSSHKNAAFLRLEERFKAQLSDIWQSIIARINKALQNDDALSLLRDIFLYIDSDSDLDLFYPEKDSAHESLQLLPIPLRDKIRDELDVCIRDLFISSEENGSVEASDFIDQSAHPNKHHWLSYFIEEQKKHNELRKAEDAAFEAAYSEVSTSLDGSDDGSVKVATDPRVVRKWSQARQESLRIGRSSGDYRYGIALFGFRSIEIAAQSFESTDDKFPMVLTSIHGPRREEINGIKYKHSHEALHVYLPEVKLTDELREEFLAAQNNTPIPSFFEEGYFIDDDLKKEVQTHLDKIELKLMSSRGEEHEKLTQKKMFLKTVIDKSQERRLSPKVLFDSIQRPEVFSATYSSNTRKLFMKVHAQIYKQAWEKACAYNDTFPGLKLDDELIDRLEERYQHFQQYETEEYKISTTSHARWRHDKCLLYKSLVEAAKNNELRPKLVDELPKTLPCYNSRSFSRFRSSVTEQDYHAVRAKHHRDVWIAIGGEGEPKRNALKAQQGRSSMTPS